MNSESSAETQSLLARLNSSSDMDRLNAVKQLGRLGYPSIEVVSALETVKIKDKNKFVRYAAKVAINKLNEITEITGASQPLSGLTEHELLVRLIKLQIEHNKLLKNYNNQLSWQWWWIAALFVVVYFINQ